MKALTLLPVLSALAIGSQTQTQKQPPTPGPAPVAVVGCSWTRAERSQGSSSDQEKKAKNAAIDQQISLETREGDPHNLKVAEETRRLEESKGYQVGLIPLPEGVVKGYLYKTQVRNVADKTIKRLEWSYVFTDVLTKKEIARHVFFSHTQIRPAEEKKLSAFTRGSPPGVINVKELGKNGSKPWDESVVIDSVEFADGTIWKPLAKTDQVKPANH